MIIDDDNDEMFPEIDTKHAETTTPPSSSEDARMTGSGLNDDNTEDASSNKFKQNPSSASNGAHPSMTLGQGNSSSGSNGGHGHKFVHPPTGYTWSRDEDAPGYAWKNKKAQEEFARAMDQIQDKDRMIKRKLTMLRCYFGFFQRIELHRWDAPGGIILSKNERFTSYKNSVQDL